MKSAKRGDRKLNCLSAAKRGKGKQSCYRLMPRNPPQLVSPAAAPRTIPTRVTSIHIFSPRVPSIPSFVSLLPPPARPFFFLSARAHEATRFTKFSRTGTPPGIREPDKSPLPSSTNAPAIKVKLAVARRPSDHFFSTDILLDNPLPLSPVHGAGS